MARWADVIIADYNYYFDFTALLYGLAQANQWQVGTLVDEAHNLVERARQMYSASLDQQSSTGSRQNAPAVLDKSFKRLNREGMHCTRSKSGLIRCIPNVPAKWLNALSARITAIGDYLNDHPQGLAGDLQGFLHFEALQFNRVLNSLTGIFCLTSACMSTANVVCPSSTCATLCRRRFYRPTAGQCAMQCAVFGHLEPAHLLRQLAGFTGRHGVDRCRVAAQ